MSSSPSSPPARTALPVSAGKSPCLRVVGCPKTSRGDICHRGRRNFSICRRRLCFRLHCAHFAFTFAPSHSRVVKSFLIFGQGSETSSTSRLTVSFASESRSFSCSSTSTRCFSSAAPPAAIRLLGSLLPLLTDGRCFPIADLQAGASSAQRPFAAPPDMRWVTEPRGHFPWTAPAGIALK
jgi:hypothetical protein